MKAVQINTYGNTDTLELNPNTTKPTLKPGQVLTEVHAASINPIDRKIRAGYLKDMMPIQFPATLGGDFAGIVTEVSPDVSEIKVGDEVYGQAIVLNGGSGAFAEYTAANRANIALKPKKVNFNEAAALPLTGVSAVQALEDHIKLQKGQRILIHGGSGGIGHLAVQLAKALGAYVATTVSTESIDFVKQLGADEIINYKTQKFETMLTDFDAVFDTVGGDVTDKSFQVLKKGGILVTMAGQPNQDLAKQHEVTALSQGTDTNTQQLTRLAELIDSGQIKVFIDQAFPLDQVKAAFTYQETGHPKGEVVITIKE